MRDERLRHGPSDNAESSRLLLRIEPGTEQVVPEREEPAVVPVAVSGFGGVMDHMKERAHEHVTQRTQRPGKPGVMSGIDERQEEGVGEPRHHRHPENQHRKERHCMGEQLVQHMEAVGGGKGERGLAVMDAVETPPIPGVLEAMNPIVEQVHGEPVGQEPCRQGHPVNDLEIEYWNVWM